MARAELFKVWASLLGAVSVAAVLTAAALATGAQAKEAGCTGQVVLDAGRGGSDSGAVNAKYGMVEKSRPRTSSGGSRRCWRRMATRSA